MQREIALKIIYKTISDNSFTNLLLRSELEKLPKIQRPFVTNLVNGVLKNYDYLNFQHKHLYKKISTKNQIILSMAVYEKFYLNEKEYVVNNEYVNLAENEYDRSFINAILHKINSLIEPSEMHIKHSLPKWIYSLLSKQYEESEFNTILENYKRVPKVYYHINSSKCSFKDLEKFDIELVNNKTFTCRNSLIDTDEFRDGYFYIQDINASTLIDDLLLSKNDVFLDACCAPGSKLFNALETIDSNNAYANDINETRVNLIKTKSESLGYNNIHFFNVDARELDKYINNKFDKILLDVPCSGLGVIGRRNDIKFHIKPENLDELQDIQKDILESASKLIKDNGYILYSTCTLNKKENIKQIDSFLNRHNDFVLLSHNTIIKNEGDMFFKALIKKV